MVKLMTLDGDAMPGQSILIVDDDEVFCEVLSAAFEKRGYQSFVAQTIDQASNITSKELPTYAVVDLKLAQESGLDCLKKLKDIHPDIRMLILTGYSSIATAVSAIKLGAVDYACKPLDADEILESLTASAKDAEKTGIADDPITVKRLQWEHIQRVLEANDGNISSTARSLGMHRRTLQRQLQKRPVKK